jgi:hypothetical protein
LDSDIGYRLYHSSFAGSIPSLKNDDDPEPVGFHPFLEFNKLDFQLAKFLFIFLA